MTKHEIGARYPEIQLLDFSSKELFIADYSDRSAGKRGVEISETPFTDSIEHLYIENEACIPVTFARIPDSGVFVNKGKDGKLEDERRCEGCLFTDEDNPKNSVALFIEIKHCKATNIAVHKEKAKEQILTTVRNFRENLLIAPQKRVYAVISFPKRNKTAFNDTLFTSMTGIQKQEFDANRIILVGCNHVRVYNNLIKYVL